MGPMLAMAYAVKVYVPAEGKNGSTDQLPAVLAEFQTQLTPVGRVQLLDESTI